MSDGGSKGRHDDVRDPLLVAAIRIAPRIVLTLALLAVIGFSSQILRWRRYSGIEVDPSETMTLLGLMAVCYLAAGAVVWAVKAAANSKRE